MSEPMSAGEIEDVLSSIRRLVSEELRPMQRAAKVQVSDAKLMLTPALRVVVDAAPASEDLGDVVGLVADALDQTTEFEDAAGDIGPHVPMAPMAWDAEPEITDEAGKFESFVFQSRHHPAVMADAVEDVHPSKEDHLASAPEPEPEGTGASDQEWPKDAPESAHSWGDEPELIEDPHWANQAEAEVMAALSAQTADPDTAERSKPTGAEPIFGDEVRFDETVLRDLVRDLIREELQGTLGERITRNVRKLVRVEVARALSLHDFD